MRESFASRIEPLRGDNALLYVPFDASHESAAARVNGRTHAAGLRLNGDPPDASLRYGALEITLGID